ncbi:cytochrome c oxidase assembly protein [Candidatus Binatia bacterium]|nr:cytochrome c oxidase assembly protein [Candidatus Binatia bacterium]
MSSVTEATLASFTLRPWTLAALALTALLYLRGWRALRTQMPGRFGAARLASFLGGLAALLIAVASPLDAFASLLLTVHMVQHLLLTMVAAPLLLLGSPQMPLLRGLPAALARAALGPFLGSPELRRAGRVLTHPVVALLAFVSTTTAWHLPVLYELALRSDAWHAVEHASFLVAALLFWWPVVVPWPSEAQWPRWAMLPYLLAADVSNTALSALFSFSEVVLYPTYAQAPRLWVSSALADQSAAGALMWVLSSIFFLIPAATIAIRLLTPPLARPGAVRDDGRDGARALAAARDAVWLRRARPFDVLDLPLVGRWMRRPSFPRVVRMVTFALATLIVLDGLLGPSMAPMNLAGVVPWTWVRGLLVIGLLGAGNWFCMACPFLLPRELGRRIFPARLHWPRVLRSKLVAAGLMVAYLCAYEAADLWDSPLATAWLLIGYAGAAFAVDGLFRGASFCKYLCPIGQFDFVLSTLSPLEVRVKQLSTCVSCTTRDCIQGNERQRGCELELYLPRKQGNLDCTFCLDCVHACPHDNVGILAVAPAADLARDPRRSSLGRLSRRRDVATLVLVIVFGAFANAAAMTAPVVEWTDAASATTGLPRAAVATLGLLLALLPLPLGLALACTVASRALSRTSAGSREVFCRYALALVPLGASMWAAHLLFHLATGGGALLPVVQRAATDLGVGALGAPSWGMAAPATGLTWLLPVLLLLLDAGLLLSLWVAWRVTSDLAAARDIPSLRAAGLLAPWGSLACVLWAAAIWILLQPMQMRGAMMHG